MAAHASAGQHKEQMSNGMLGFILFLSSEVMFFGGLFAAYFIARADSAVWPPELSAEQIERGVHLELEFALPFISTIILVLSSVTIQMGVWAIQKGDRSGLIRWLFISIALGLTFLTCQMYDYSQLHFTSGDTIYGTTFYTLTGFHGAHVAGGVIFMMVMLVRTMAGQFSASRHEAIEACSFYWHFVDVVWLALFATSIHLGLSRRSPPDGPSRQRTRRTWEHGGVHLPDPSVWPIAAGLASFILGAGIIFYSANRDHDFAGPLFGAAFIVALIVGCGWAYEDGRMKRKAEAGIHGGPRNARYTQVVTFTIPEGQYLAARADGGIVSQLEASDSRLRDLDGFQDMRVIVSPALDGPSQVILETTWADAKASPLRREPRHDARHARAGFRTGSHRLRPGL